MDGVEHAVGFHQTKACCKEKRACAHLTMASKCRVLFVKSLIILVDADGRSCADGQTGQGEIMKCFLFFLAGAKRSPPFFPFRGEEGEMSSEDGMYVRCGWG